MCFHAQIQCVLPLFHFPFLQNTVYFEVCEVSIAAQKATEVKLYDLHWWQSTAGDLAANKLSTEEVVIEDRKRCGASSFMWTTTH